jgi:hypothetical protein
MPLNFDEIIERRTPWLVGLGDAAAVIAVYNSDWSCLNEIIRIPVIEYLVAFIMAGIVALGFWIKTASHLPFNLARSTSASAMTEAFRNSYLVSYNVTPDEPHRLITAH